MPGRKFYASFHPLNSVIEAMEKYHTLKDLKTKLFSKRVSLVRVYKTFKMTYLMVLRRGTLIVDDAGHKGGLTNPCPWRRQCRAGFSNTGGSPKPHSGAPRPKKYIKKIYEMAAVGC